MNSIETVFEWLLAATLRASVLVVVILSIQLLLRRWLPASWRHALWLPMLAVLVLPVLPEAPFAVLPQTAVSPAPAVVLANAVSAEESTAVSAPIITTVPKISDARSLPIKAEKLTLPADAAPPVTSKLPVFAIAWLVGAIGMFVMGFVGYRRNMRRIRINATAPDREMLASIAEAAREAGLKRAPHTMLSPAVESPAVTGFTSPVLLLPAGFPAGFSPAEARLILLHEFTHLKRLDLPLNWLMCVLQAMHWFNPLLWFAFARMRADRESACDARVLSIDASDRRAEYGGALLKLQCVTPNRALSLGFVGIFERGSGIKSRIRDISTHRRTRLARQIAGGFIVTLLMIFGVTKGQQASPPADAPESVKEAAPAAPEDRREAGFIRRKLHFVKVTEILPVAANALKRAQPSHKAIAQPGGAMGGKADKAPEDDATDSATPPNILVGDTLLVADVITNSLIVQGPPARLIIVESLLDLIDVNPPVQEGGKEVIQEKLRSIIIPTIDFVDVSVEEAIEFLRVRAAELDGIEQDPAKKGVNFVIRNPRDAAAAPMIRKLRLRNVSIGAALKEICEQANLSYTVEETAMVIAPRNAAGAEPAVPADADADAATTAVIQDKLKSIIIPRIDFVDISVEDAIEFLRVRATELDVTEQDPAKKGINFVIRNPRNAAAAAAPAPMIRELRLRNVSLGAALKEICAQANLSYTVDVHAIVIAPKNETGAEPAVPADAAAATTAVIQDKLKSIIIPRIDFVDVSVEDAIEFLRVRAAQLDVGENDPAKKGVNLVIRNPAAAPAPMIRELRLRNVSLGAALKEICEQTKLRYTVEDTGVILSPQDEAGADPADLGRDSNAARCPFIHSESHECDMGACRFI